jgi:hypothetical protein
VPVDDEPSTPEGEAVVEVARQELARGETVAVVGRGCCRGVREVEGGYCIASLPAPVRWCVGSSERVSFVRYVSDPCALWCEGQWATAPRSGDAGVLDLGDQLVIGGPLQRTCSGSSTSPVAFGDDRSPRSSGTATGLATGPISCVRVCATWSSLGGRAAARSLKLRRRPSGQLLET